MEPLLSINDKLMFYKYLDNSKVYLEYGSGGSTYQASIRNIHIYSIESDKNWHDKLKKNIDNNKINYIHIEMDTQPHNWGYPGPNSTKLQQIKYSDYIRKLSKEERENIDLVFIDGRFRVSCCLKCFDVIKNDCVIAFDDFLNRQHYHIVLDYYEIVDLTIDERMVILKKKDNINYIPESIIKKYEIIPQ